MSSSGQVRGAGLSSMGLWVALIGSVVFGCAVTPREVPVPATDEYRAQIRRTEGGIPHIKADDLGSLAFGAIYAQAEDNLCILAEQYLTFGAERSRHLGGENGNRESDLFHQYLIDRGDAAAPLPDDLEAVFAGGAAGYNHFLETTSEAGLRDSRCGDAEWLRPVAAIDLKRVSRADYAMAYMRPMIVSAAPPSADEPAAGTFEPLPFDLAQRVEAYLEVPKQGGSNAVAIGRLESAEGRGMLLANPHMPWNEPFQRFYPMHQTLPGRFDVMGANLIGRPRVGFGHTEDVAWTSTVSTARRQSFYQLTLDPEDPTAYLFDGESMPMTQRTVTIEERSESGELRPVTHTFYETHFGGVLVKGPFFPWTREHAVAVRLLDAAWRGETSVLDQYRATSVRELKAVHNRDQFLPVNLIAADAHGEVLYADPGPIPNLPDEVMADCAVMRGAALDGSRSECQWGVHPEAVVPGIFAPAQLPSLFREDFVTNSNDSFWLANPAEPLEGFPRSLGTARTQRTLRTRSGLEMVLRAAAGEERISLEELKELAFANENFASQLIREDVIAFCRETPSALLDGPGRIDLSEACEVLAAWDQHANLDSRGAALFRQFMNAAQQGQFSRVLPESFTPAIAFDPERPLETPRGLAPEAKPAVLQALGVAVHELTEAGIALDAALGDVQSESRGARRIPLHGGPEIEGIFNKIEASFQGEAGYPTVDSWSSSWILAVEFTDAGPRTFGVLTYSLSADPDSPHFADQTELFSRKEWVPLPFREAEVEAAALRSYSVGAPR